MAVTNREQDRPRGGALAAGKIEAGNIEGGRSGGKGCCIYAMRHFLFVSPYWTTNLSTADYQKLDLRSLGPDPLC